MCKTDMVGGIEMVVTIDNEKCTMCGAYNIPICVEKCPTEALQVRDCKIVVTEFLCEDCNECGFVCPDKAMEIKEFTW